MGLKPEFTMKRVTEDGFIERLKNIATTRYYDYQLPCESEVCMSGSRLWQSEKEADPWELLLFAIVSLAAKEYVQTVIFEKKYKRPCERKREIEEFLNNWSPEITDRLQSEIRYHERRNGIRGIEQMECRMKVMY